MRQEHERTGLQYQQYAQGLAEAVEQQQAASRAAVHWREVLDKTEDRHARRYQRFEHVEPKESCRGAPTGFDPGNPRAARRLLMVARAWLGPARPRAHRRDDQAGGR